MRLHTLAFLLSAACSPQQQDDHFFLRSDGADLPVWVAGNTDSGVLLVWLAGGPGDPIAVMRGEATRGLEDHYGVVYWDQRGCGSAQGNPSPESFTMDQFVEDTDRLVDLVTERYHPADVFLVGHSWGGTLATAYLLDPGRQQKVSGWLDLGGNPDHPAVFPMKIDWLRAFAEERIAAGDDVDQWTEVRDWCDTEPAHSAENMATWEHYVDDTNAAFSDPDGGFPVGADLVLFSGESAFAYLLINSHYAADQLFANGEQERMAYFDRLDEITAPTAILWGAHDGIVPLPAGEETYARLGTPDEDKRLVVFEDSAHFTFVEEPDAFVDAVADFVDGVRRNP